MDNPYVRCTPCLLGSTALYLHTLQEEEYKDVTANITLGNVASGRSESFAAIFLITLFLGLSLGLAIYAGVCMCLCVCV